jgi:hypothetical protein
VDIHIGAHPGQNQTLKKIRDKREGNNPFIDQESWPTFLAAVERGARQAFDQDPL